MRSSARASVRLPESASSRVGDAAFSFLLSSPCLHSAPPSGFPMSATRLSSTSTATMPAYMGSLRLAAISEHERIDKQFGSSSPAFSSSLATPSESDFVASQSSPYTVPPRGALVFQQHVHRIPKPMRPSQKFRIWYRGIFWETLEPVSTVCLSARTIDTEREKKTQGVRRGSLPKAGETAAAS